MPLGTVHIPWSHPTVSKKIVDLPSIGDITSAFCCALTVLATSALFRSHPLMSFVLFPRNLFCPPRRLRRKMPFCFSLSVLAREPQPQRFGIVNVCSATVLRARLELNPRNNTLFPAFDAPTKSCSVCVRPSYRDVVIPNILYEL